ncbi:MAG: 16S rRNA (uracil(1498)-N(3))-methyltransferase [Thermomicrobiales bacterium]|nr:16S rRNA (uracil(1498)-N(3))-methyltransferase [Thermomicrobiales bacterium]
MTGWRCSSNVADRTMRRHRFIVEQPLAAGSHIALSSEQGRQARSVLRLRVGDPLEICDGAGRVADGRISSVERSEVTVEIESLRDEVSRPPIHLTVGLALLRGERFDLAVQKLTEVGVSSIIPLAAQHCVVSYAVDRDWERRAARLRRIAIEATEQSERTMVPHIDRPVSIEDMLADRTEKSVFALLERSAEVSTPIADVAFAERTTILIGPEGGWSDAEQMLLRARAQPVTLGAFILRSETAAIVAAGTLMQRAWSARTHEEVG